MQFTIRKGYFMFLAVFAITVIYFQIEKRNAYITKIQQHKRALVAAKFPYAKLVDQIPIYKDSTYAVYIAVIEDTTKLVFLRKDTISAKQRESRFFVHIYPKNKKLLPQKSSHLVYDFKNNVTSFFMEGTKYFISRTDLPNFMIENLNVGQYGFRGDNSINWKPPHLLNYRDIGKTLKENKEKVSIFEVVDDSF